MSRNQKLILLMITIVNAWSLLIPFYGPVLEKMVSRSGNDYNSAKTVCIVVYMVLLFLFTYVTKEENARYWIIIGTACLACLTSMMWFIPQTQNFFTFGLLGLFSAMVKTPIYILLIYGLNSMNKTKTVGAFLFGTYFLGILFRYAFLTISADVIFIETVALLGVIFFLAHKYDYSGFIHTSMIEEKDFPIKTMALLGMLFMTAFLCNGLLENAVYPHSLGKYNDIMLHMEWVPQILVYLIILLFYKRVNLYFLLNLSIVAMGAASLLFILVEQSNILTNIVIDLSYGIFDIFMYIIFMELSLRYGRNYNVLRAILFFVMIGSVIGEGAWKEIIEHFYGRRSIVCIVILAALFSCIFIMPWFIKTIQGLFSNTFEKENDLKLEDNADQKIEPELSFHQMTMEKLIYLNNILAEEEKLTPREIEVAAFLVQRFDQDTIANELFISKNTLKVHIKHIYSKFKVSNKKEFCSMIKELENKSVSFSNNEDSVKI